MTLSAQRTIWDAIICRLVPNRSENETTVSLAPNRKHFVTLFVCFESITNKRSSFHMIMFGNLDNAHVSNIKQERLWFGL